MSRKIVGMLSLLLLAGVLSGVSHASAFPSQITFGPSPFNSVTFTGTNPGETVTFSGVTGPASLFNGTTSTLGAFTISDATIALTGSDLTGGFFLAPTALDFTVTLTNLQMLVGKLTLQDLSTGQSWAPQFLGTLLITSADPQFQSAGFLPNMTVDTDFAVYIGRSAKTVNFLWTNPGSSSGYVSAGEVTPDSSVPEPGTIALMGTGLLGLAGYLRRRS